MSRYTRTNTASMKRHPNGVGDFIGWDDLEGLSEEATDPADLGLTMHKRDQEQFTALAPGETSQSGLFTFFRAW